MAHAHRRTAADWEAVTVSLHPLVLLLMLVAALLVGALLSLLASYQVNERAQQQMLEKADVRIMAALLQRMIAASQAPQFLRHDYFDLLMTILAENTGAPPLVIARTAQNDEIEEQGAPLLAPEQFRELARAVEDQPVVWASNLPGASRGLLQALGGAAAILFTDGPRALYLHQPLPGLSPARHELLFTMLRAIVFSTNASRAAAWQQHAADKLSRELQVQILNLWRVLGGLHHNFRGIFAPGAFEIEALAERVAAGEAVAIEEYQRVVAKLAPSVPILIRLTESMGDLQKHLRADHGPAMMESQEIKELFVEHFNAWLERQIELKKDRVSLRVAIPDQMQVLVERTAFFQVVWNVLHNALKYTRDGHVEISAKEGRDQRIYLVIEDTGPGIAQDELERIGTYEYRAAATREIQGQGVGLWLSKQMLEPMGGEMRIASEPGTGTRVEIGFQRAVLGRRRPR